MGKLNNIIPKNIGDLQLNFCDSTTCINYGKTDDYYYHKTTDSGEKTYKIECKSCKKQTKPVNNAAVVKFSNELSGLRYIGAIKSKKEGCKNGSCCNFGISVIDSPDLYKKNGKNASGGQRFLCKQCNKSLTIAKTKTDFAFNRKTHKNKIIFSSLINGLGIRRISYLNEISAQTVYDKLDFFYEQCLRFNQHFDAKISKKKFIKLRLSTDSMSATTNWRSRRKELGKGKSGLHIKLLVTCDNWSGFCLGQSINFDPSVSSKSINASAVKNDEFSQRLPDRTNPHYIYDAEGKLGDYYLNDIPTKVHNYLDAFGIKIRTGYTYLSHYYNLKTILKSAKKVVVYGDTSASNILAIKRIFKEEIIGNKFNSYTVRFEHHAKGTTKTVRQKLIDQNKEEWDKFLEENEYLWKELLEKEQLSSLELLKKRYTFEAEIKEKLIKLRYETLSDKTTEPWVQHPTPKLTEHNKSVQWETRRKDETSNDYIYKDMSKASTWSADNYFQKIRFLSFFKRITKRRDGSDLTQWEQDKAYDPKKLIIMAELFKTYHNFIAVGKDGKTPAMRLGVTRKVWDINKVLTKKY